jgi:hypothetical protein
LATIFPTDADIDDAERIEEEISQSQQVDDMMVDAIAQEEEAELDALLSSMPRDDVDMPEERPSSPYFSEDEDYDALFMDFISQQGQAMGISQDEDTEMS